MGMQWDENQPDDFVRYARGDLMGLVREDLIFDIARHVDATVHKFEEWGLPIMKDPKTGHYLREGKWQVMIHGESYKPIIAEAARKSASTVYNRIMVTHLLMDKTHPNRVAGAVGFDVRNGSFYVFRAKAVIVSAGGASHIYRAPLGRRRHGTDLVCALEQRARPTVSDPAHRRQNDRRWRTRSCSPASRMAMVRSAPGSCCSRPYATNAYGENYEAAWLEEIKSLVGKYADTAPMPTCLRNHAMLEEIKAGKGPIYMQTQNVARHPGEGGNRLGGLPRHDRQPGGGLGLAEHRSQGYAVRADHLRTLRHGLSRHLFRRLGQRTGGLRAGRLPVGIQPDDHG